MGLGSKIRKKPIPDPGSRGQKSTGSRIRIRNTGTEISVVQNWLENPALCIMEKSLEALL